MILSSEPLQSINKNNNTIDDVESYLFIMEMSSQHMVYFLYAITMYYY